MNWAHVHLLIDHLPVVGLLGVVLAVGVAKRSQDVIRLVLGLPVFRRAPSVP